MHQHHGQRPGSRGPYLAMTPGSFYTCFSILLHSRHHKSITEFLPTEPGAPRSQQPNNRPDQSRSIQPQLVGLQEPTVRTCQQLTHERKGRCIFQPWALHSQGRRLSLPSVPIQRKPRHPAAPGEALFPWDRGPPPPTRFLPFLAPDNSGPGATRQRP